MREAIMVLKSSVGDVNFYPVEGGPSGMEVGKVYLLSRLNEPLSIGVYVNPMFCDEDLEMPFMARVLKYINESDSEYIFTWVRVTDKDETTVTLDALFNNDPPIKMRYRLTEDDKRKLH